jgi:methionyl-tRNA formyltransferase
MENKNLRIVFMGTPDFAVESLKRLVDEGYNIVGVITVPDKPAGRGQKLRESAVKVFAENHNLPILQPVKLKDPAFLTELASLKADLQIVVAFRMLPEVVWNMPQMGTFNLHASLLPHYRGAAPLNRAIMNGEKESGVTTFLLKHEIDTGNIIFRERVAIEPYDNVGDLHDKLMIIGAGLVVKTVDALAAEDIVSTPQVEILVKEEDLKHAPKIFKDDCKIDWNLTGQQIHNHIRGLSPFPVAWTNLFSKESDKPVSLKVFSSDFEIINHENKPGTISSDNKSELKVACSGGHIYIKELQLAGKKRMKTEDFLRGFKNIDSFYAV